MYMSKGEFAFIGTGEVPCGRYPERSPLEIASTVAKLAIEDAGIKKTDIDAVLSAAAVMDNDYTTDLFFGRLPEAFGLRKSTKVFGVSVAGGGSSYVLRKTAEGLLAAGECEMILVVHAQRFTSFSPQEQAEYFAKAGADPEWEIPYGISFNSLSALITQRYMHDTGTTIEGVASVCVSCRKWAMLQDNAMFNKKDLTVEDVLNSRMVSTPLTAFMCNVLADGGSAFIMTTAERAKKLVKKPVYILGEDSRYSHRNLTVCEDLTTLGGGGKIAADKAYQEAGLGPEDMDIAEIYGSYPVISLIFLEQFGFCKRGEAGRFVLEGNTWPGGKLPMATNGEALSFGHTGTGCGMAILAESIRQLQGKAGRAQVPGAKFLIEDCGGGAFSDVHCTVMGNEIP
jgi:acetyl-CoA C-acetyltransferase